ncbi:RecX family transcriptional regulator [Qipengyuania sp. SS22]|uniref:regulatory protein RecX n=1 Tax=Qipengyuania sp. SS22 TaxID=2979461 RepID=UPI0021E566CD|nr:RecX family transcriptional regulator [Qipengyuania sp. SS22]UYH54190.1 RecX family transcriptional regulator [Qipengyuania sp. SS22]
MDDERATSGRARRRAKPLDRTRLEELAVSYVARFATSAGKLRAYLQRKLRERGFTEDEEPDLDRLIAKFVDRGYVDDEAYGRAKASDLVARGYGARRVDQALRTAGIDEDLRHALEPEEAQKRQAAVVLARKRGFGPFGQQSDLGPEEARKLREKRLAALVRAGHDFDIARRIVEARTVEELEGWVAEARDEEQ